MPIPEHATAVHAFQRMCFRHDWRSYQSRILAEMADHLEDRKLHVVAAPGAGKTVLGLEIIRRLRGRTLILAPSLLVRDQWIARLCDDFLDGERPDWISTDLHADVPLRLSTYQNIHQNRAKPMPPMDVICLDEAHHLRRAWWQSLTRLQETHQPVTLSLTATPPYDSEPWEWENYSALCGPVDAEISVPELVLTGDLCPHQDLVFVARTTDRQAYDQNLAAEKQLFASLSADPQLLTMLQQSPWITDCENQSQKILENPELFSAMLIYLRDAGQPLPSYARRLLRLDEAEWPRLDWSWLQILLAAHLTTLPEAMLARLKTGGALRNDRLSLPPPRFADRISLLDDDKSRLEATSEIHRQERETRGDGLRMAILLDRIGHVAMKLDHEPRDYNAGAVFRWLHREGGYDDLALLTGQMVCLPRRLCDRLAGREVSGMPGYIIVAGPDFQNAVTRVNEAFGRGDIRVVIGTQAFLGQGWDAPALNALVLGTSLARFVAVNQLRGRALRKDRNVADKSANIWHLAIVPGSRVEGEEVARLHRRFDCFARLDRPAGEIRSHFAPLADIGQQNQMTCDMARRHTTLAAEWQIALRAGAEDQPQLMRESGINRGIRQQVVPVSALSWRGRLMVMFGRDQTDDETRRGLERLARLVIEALRELGDLPSATPLSPEVSQRGGRFYISLRGASRLTESLFHDSLRQLLDPVVNPRYVIIVRSGLFTKRFQYFAVPPRFDGRKERAEIFWRNWQGIVGRGELIYTRTPMGRGELQAARLNSHQRHIQSHLSWR
ncbi:DEAD/DEAH box helicase family protein [Paracoccus caeni]|uniref:DEAD/DEAH box helicase family protein n=1 Tax=Paracoccus caeni TaxID=657651 RepID=A0A934SFG6_9RHOB|nr:DEAD/DEAH box helicase family protein [Paracoccus caeni]MBK4216912.1 DEAD/DEAH box helicase family protein [Paracoccus caeni]